MRVTPSTERMVSARRWITAPSRPSLTFGTHSTAGAEVERRDMRCILPVGMQSLPIGKLRAETLQAIFDKHHTKDPRVVVGPRVGEDAAVIDMGDRYLVATSDPITFATAEIGWYALHVNANDIAVRGARPRWFLATLLLPAGATTDASVEALFADLHAACEELEVILVGGHTEITHGLDRPIVAGTMLGEVEKDKLVTTAGARVGDAVVMTKGVPLEGAAIIAREKEAELRAFVEKNVDRRWYPEGGARQYLSIIASGDRVEMLKRIKVPTLVLHGEDDPLLPVECGRDVARLVPAAEIQTYPGWGHDFPKGMIPTVIERIVTFCKGK